MTQALMNESIVAVDTESNSLYAYQERVCLIQFSIPDDDFLVDPLALHDLSALAPLFSSPKIEKIFHAAEYDIIMLEHDFGFTFCNLFDTMVAARILGWKAVGLAPILKEQFGIDAEKKYQRADWGKRPIPYPMQVYAQLDTHFLIPLRTHLKAELQKNQRWLLALEDFQRACHITNNNPDRNGVDCLRINGARDLNPQQLAVLQELCIYRDQIAQASDRPLFKVINNDTLFSIAELCPRNLDELEAIKGFSQKQSRWLGRGLLAAVQRGLHSQPLHIRQKPRPSDEYLQRVEKLRQWRKKTGHSLGVESDVVLPKDLLYQLAEENPQNREHLAQILETVPWRRQKFGDDLFELLLEAA